MAKKKGKKGKVLQEMEEEAGPAIMEGKEAAPEKPEKNTDQEE